jgi:hypothetical protein
MRTLYRGLLLLGCVVLATHSLGAQGSAKDDSWKSLKQVTHRRVYTFEDRERNCVRGQIVKVTEQGITFKRWTRTGIGNTTAGMDRAKLLRVMDGSYPHSFLYSGRSSWSDVQVLQGLPPGGSVELITRDGRRHQGQLADLSENHVTLRQREKAERIAKDDISRVYFVRYTPASDRAMYDAQEGFYFDPELWPYAMHIAPKISVLVYDSSMPEDDAPVACKNNPWLPAANLTQ